MSKKVAKVIISVITFVVVIFLSFVALIWYCMKDSVVASHPSWIASKADFDLPQYDVVSRDDNMDRSASAWSEYNWDLKLKEPLTEDQKEELDQLVKNDSRWAWSDVSKCYHFEQPESEDQDASISITVYPNDRRVYITYSWWDILA